MDANSPIEHYYNKGSGYFHCNDCTRQYPEMYIDRLALNISLYYTDKTPRTLINSCNISCDFFSGEEIKTNGSCHNDSTTVNVDIPINDSTVTMIMEMYCMR